MGCLKILNITHHRGKANDISDKIFANDISARGLYTHTHTHTHIYIREGNGNPLQYSCLENPMDGGAWWATVHGVTKSQT